MRSASAGFTPPVAKNSSGDAKVSFKVSGLDRVVDAVGELAAAPSDVVDTRAAASPLGFLGSYVHSGLVRISAKSGDLMTIAGPR
jgi:hypothetical protein